MPRAFRNLNQLLISVILKLYYFAGHFKQKKSKSDHSPSSKDPQGWSPFIFEAISYNALAYFLLANLLTGAVNFSVQTMHVSSWYQSYEQFTSVNELFLGRLIESHIRFRQNFETELFASNLMQLVKIFFLESISLNYSQKTTH